VKFQNKYMAGLFDGHGSVSYNFGFDNKGRRTRFQVVIQVSSPMDSVQVVADMIQSADIKCKLYISRKKEKCAVEKQLCITNRVDGVKFLKRICPHLILKQDRVISALKEIKAYYESFESKTRPKTQLEVLKLTENLVGGET